MSKFDATKYVNKLESDDIFTSLSREQQRTYLSNVFLTDEQINEIFSEIDENARLSDLHDNFASNRLDSIDFVSILSSAIYKECDITSLSLEKNDKIDNSIVKSVDVLKKEIQKSIDSVYKLNTLSSLTEQELAFYSVEKKSVKCFFQIENSKTEFSCVFIRDLIATKAESAHFERNRAQNKANVSLKHIFAMLKKKNMLASSHFVRFKDEMKSSLTQLKVHEIVSYSDNQSLMQDFLTAINEHIAELSAESKLEINCKIVSCRIKVDKQSDKFSQAEELVFTV